MYRRASSFLQAMARKAAENSKPWRPMVAKKRTRAHERRYWWPKIAHHHRKKTSIQSEYGGRYPDWLKKEVAAMGAEAWLRHWNRKTGKRSRASTTVSINAASNPNHAVARKAQATSLAPKSAAGKVREAEPSKKAIRSERRYENPEVVAERLGRRMAGVEVYVREGAKLIRRAAQERTIED